MATLQPWLGWHLVLMLLIYMKNPSTFMTLRSVCVFENEQRIGTKTMSSLIQGLMDIFKLICLRADLFIGECGTSGGENEDHSKERTHSEV